MRANTGSVYYDKTKKRYYAAITTPAGQRKKKSFTNKLEVGKWKNAQLTDVDRGVFVEPTDITIGAWSILWLRTYKKGAVKQRTYERYKQLIAYLDPVVNIKLQGLKPVQVQQLYQKLLLKLSANTVNKVHKILKELYTKAYVLDMVPKILCLPLYRLNLKEKKYKSFQWKRLS